MNGLDVTPIDAQWHHGHVESQLVEARSDHSSSSGRSSHRADDRKHSSGQKDRFFTVGEIVDPRVRRLEPAPPQSSAITASGRYVSLIDFHLSVWNRQ